MFVKVIGENLVGGGLPSILNRVNNLPDDVICNIAIYVNDTTLL